MVKLCGKNLFFSCSDLNLKRGKQTCPQKQRRYKNRVISAKKESGDEDEIRDETFKTKNYWIWVFGLDFIPKTPKYWE